MDDPCDSDTDEHRYGFMFVDAWDLDPGGNGITR